MRAVVVHGVEIPESLIAEEAQNHPSLSAAEARIAAGHALATKALLLRRAADLGLSAQPERDEEGREETPEAALIRAVLDAEVEVTPPTDAECRRVYDAQHARFRTPPLYEAAHILIEPRGEDEAAVESARAWALDLCGMLSAAPERFGELARTLSHCPSANVGGSLGQLRPGDLTQEVEAALLALSPGEISRSPVRSRFGWHILKLERFIEGRRLPFEQVAESIRLQLEGRSWTGAAARYVQRLAEEAQSAGVAVSLMEDGAVRGGSLCLGDFLSPGAAGRLMAWLEAGDPALAARVKEVGDSEGVQPQDLALTEASAFVSQADDEAWTQLISAAQGAEDPALAALAAILRRKLAPPKAAFTVIARRGAR